MGLFKKDKSENERSTDVAKKDKSEQTEEQATPQEQAAPQESAEGADNEGGLSDDDQKALVQFKEELPPEVFENIQHLMTMMNPDKKGFEEMGGARWSPPVVKIRQGTSTEAPESAALGDIYTDTGDVCQRLEFTPLYLYKTRAKFEEDTPQPVCRSENGETSIYGNPCKECPDFAFKKGERQSCAESINALAFGKDMDQIYHLQFARTSFKAGFKLFRQASATARMWDRWYALKTEERTRQTGTKTKYHVFVVTPTGEKVDPRMRSVMAKFNEKITASRQIVLEKVAERENSGKQLVDQLDKSQFGGDGGDGSGDGAAPEPDFSTNKNL
jgi:hypothetical protein